jgi:hypothetical protein
MGLRLFIREGGMPRDRQVWVFVAPLTRIGLEKQDLLDD